jgi:hypothetical protein
MNIAEIRRRIVNLPWTLPHAIDHFQYERAVSAMYAQSRITSPMKPGSERALAQAEQVVEQRHRRLVWSANRMPQPLQHDHPKAPHGR